VRRGNAPGYWNSARIDERGLLRLDPIGGGPESAALERSVEQQHRGPVPIFSGLGDGFVVYLDLSRPSDEWLLVLRMTLDRGDLLSALPQHAWLFALGTLVYLCLCIGLAQVFGRSIAAPLAALSRCAGARSFVTQERCLKRRDELGELSRALADMEAEIEGERGELADRALMLSSMNRIDRAVLASGLRMELFDQVLAAVLDYVPARLAAVVTRDPDGGGFDLAAFRRRGADKAHPGFFISDDRFSPELLFRFADSYEVPLSELGEAVEEAFRMAAGEEGPSKTERLSFVNLPFAATHLYDGSLVLIREAGGADFRRFTPLADQVGVALKDLEARESKSRSWMALVRSLVQAVDAKSAWTRGHSERVAATATALGKKLLMSESELSRLERAAVLHDVGKIGVPETILDKPASLTAEEMALIRRHPAMGAEILGELSDPEYLGLREAVLYHHERWDGSGYPEGLKGEEIPLAARIIAIADVHDAITADRPYRAGMEESKARVFIADGAGILFDPQLVRIFLAEGSESP
jgi:HD-GYP domain-containing protein (c-di-GMP phosphodiesterase class II)